LLQGEVFKKIAEMFKELPPKKMLKYQERAEVARQEYTKAIEKF
jgi:HMG (high mobility group) box